MRILYGVQATGNGHISRARAMEQQLRQAGVTVDFLFSGRPAEQFFDMQQFGRYQLRRGLTFISQAGRVNYWQSAKQASLRELWRDIRSLDVSSYDLVLTDFEPVTAWAAQRQQKTCIGIGHQYAFLQPIPMENASLLSHNIFRHFAPAKFSLGLHWHHFNQPILPPIIDLPKIQSTLVPKQVLVYLPFEDQQQVMRLLTPLTDFTFSIYGPGLTIGTYGHIRTQPPSLQAFKTDLLQSEAVLSNAGFELISEALQLQKHILVKPLQGQMEQQSNALALTQLKLASRANTLSTKIIAEWLNGPRVANNIQYPNVAAAICDWLLQDTPDQAQRLVKALW
ncbi:glycosyl transferase [Alishewanella longhuensis]|uniref:Glycosyl transferase n=1 Tax=Alishewanella longhuensis TaxID=1091037 RepID=A0ABQ3KZC4_9ALTE|nr:MJ1255/VC2487 family glycosyltransferase [Alishewanella longhuensis]GHG69637.1 glycosyl transferase [Alishewanella longhuensis]